ncbi:uncharacterized protein METZ01_LOCUS344226 [marine metagenome]|uniref:Uncharacterized protein n=1 Tax=marine metagenome TaxID=408172 RepID=A0A382R2J9_9ZZZZ
MNFLTSILYILIKGGGGKNSPFNYLGHSVPLLGGELGISLILVLF